jgi:hypothetical protein
MKIEFIPSSQEVVDFVEAPQSSKHCIPQWYKNIPGMSDKSKKIFEQGTITNRSLKMCMPYFDALSGGFIQKTWCDIYIGRENNEFKYHWAHAPTIIGHREAVHMPLSDRYYNFEFFWNVPWIPKLPNGWSLLMTHPHNRLELPFTTCSGIIDSDTFYHQGFGNYPFYVNKDFEGIIPAGTPMFQMIPIKRESWKSVVQPFNEDKHKKRAYTMLREFFGVYKNKFWQKKNYD